MSLKTSDIRFKERIRIQIQDPIMRKAVANAQERIFQSRDGRRRSRDSQQIEVGAEGT